MTPEISDQNRVFELLRTQLHDAEQAAAEYRAKLTEAQADIAGMKTRWYAAEKARNAVNTARQADSSGLLAQLALAQKELDRTQQAARSDMEKAAARIRVLEERLAAADATVDEAETLKLRYRHRSIVFLLIGLAFSALLAGIVIYTRLPHAPAPTAEVHPPTPVHPGCDVKWSNGQPTVTFGAKGSSALAISNCADQAP
jgi:multidrug efflux pump subunit AcrA (membrane-fusion protein)